LEATVGLINAEMQNI